MYNSQQNKITFELEKNNNFSNKKPHFQPMYNYNYNKKKFSLFTITHKFILWQ